MTSLKLPDNPPVVNDTYILTPVGEYLGVLIDVVDLGWTEKWDKDDNYSATPWMKLVFQLDHLSPNGTRYKVSCRFEAEFEKTIIDSDGNEKVVETKLHRILRQWNVIDKMADEEGNAEFENLIGVNGMVLVEHTINKAGIATAHFSRVLPVAENTLIATPYNRVCDRPDYIAPEFSAFGGWPFGDGEGDGQEYEE